MMATTSLSTRGVFISFEGVEGCGKSTQIERLRAYLTSCGYTVVLTREPGGTPIAEAIRQVLLNPEHAAMRSTTELLLYEAARAQHVDERLRPALEAGAILLCDRFADSTTAYQCGGRGVARDTVQALHEIATGGLWPDLTIVLDVPADIGLARATRGGSDRIEQEALTFHERVRAEFLRLADDEPARVRRVDGLRDIDTIAADIRALVDSLLTARGVQRT